mmetsp:Transcript_8873/g.13238  ORF Transcript_8873/g.13238 Transcript_8873/m.13238 type:complete len:199 (+) Transcript_8873:111-707(+)
MVALVAISQELATLLDCIKSILQSMSTNDTFTVFNAGLGGATALENIPNSYRNSDYHKYTLSVANTFSILIIQFGTNDAARNRMADESFFINDYENLIQSYRDVHPNLIIFLSIPPPVYLGPQPINKIYSIAVNERLPNIIKSISVETNCRLIDVFNALGGKNLTKPQCFTEDGIHPNDLGYNLIAETVAARMYSFLI